MFSTLTILPLLALIGLLAAVCVKRIPEGQVYTLRRLGKPARTLTPGMHVVVPLVERIAHKISITGYTLAIEERVQVEGHPAPETLRGRVWWQVLDPERAEAVIDRADDMIRSRVIGALPEVAGDSGTDLRARNLRVKQALNGSLRERGVLVTRVELDLAA
ncbi:MAG TPA: SPFH domain-containing protein [Rhodanobacteraceae bacterium]|nr:SPFH domain-containing protein [Rhodanobacteraceae bacterium]